VVLDFFENAFVSVVKRRVTVGYCSWLETTNFGVFALIDNPRGYENTNGRYQCHRRCNDACKLKDLLQYGDRHEGTLRDFARDLRSHCAIDPHSLSSSGSFAMLTAIRRAAMAATKVLIRAPQAPERRAAARMTGRYLVTIEPAPRNINEAEQGRTQVGPPLPRVATSAKPLPDGSHLTLRNVGVALVDPKPEQEDALHRFAAQERAVIALERHDVALVCQCHGEGPLQPVADGGQRTAVSASSTPVGPPSMGGQPLYPAASDARLRR